MSDYKVVGRPLPRIEGPAKVTGEIVYAADMKLPGMLYAKILRSPYAHARILRIDTSAAKKVPGVHAVITAHDLPEANRDPGVRAHVVFASDEILFHNQPIAAVAAESPESAEEALDLIDVEYLPLPAVLDVEAAIEPGSPLTRLGAAEDDTEPDREGHSTFDVGTAQTGQSAENTNLTGRLRFVRGDIERGFAEADIVLEGRFDAAMVHQSPLELQVAVANYDSLGRLTVWGPTQAQFHQREEIAHILGLEIDRVRLISTEIGGGFGGRVAPLVHPAAGLLSIITGRPIKITLTRREELACGVPAQRTVTYVKVGARNDGTLTTLQARVLFDSGAFAAGLGLASIMVGACYRYENFDIDSVKVLTNKVSTGAYRAPGVPEVLFGVEQLVDEIARRVGLDPIAIRRKNAVREGDLMPNGKPWPRIGFLECLDAIEQSQFWKTRGASNGSHRTGIGLAAGAWLGGFQPASALVRLNENGTASLVMGANDISGTNTSYAQIVAEVIGLPMEQVDAYTADTDTAPYAGMVTGSKSIYSYGVSVKAAAEDARRQILTIAGFELGVEPSELTVDDGLITAPDGRTMTFQRVGGLSMSNGARYSPVLGRGGEVVRNVAPGFTVQAVALDVDESTGNVTLKKVVAVQDVGTAINPLSVEGQLEGGVVQSLGMGLTEEMLYDGEGRLRNPTFLDYRLLTSLDVPTIESILVQVPSPEGPFGARIVGEPSIVAASSAVANAVRDAIGVRVHEAPLTPERVAQAIRESRLLVATPA